MRISREFDFWVRTVSNAELYKSGYWMTLPLYARTTVDNEYERLQLCSLQPPDSTSALPALEDI